MILVLYANPYIKGANAKSNRSSGIHMRISIVGGGYVGLVSALCLADLGHSIDLIEIDASKVAAINSGKPPIYEAGLDRLLDSWAGSRLIATTSYECLWQSDITIICVGTPLGPDGRADLSMVRSASENVGGSIRQKDGYHIVAVKSTVPPGTTNNLVIPIVLTESGRDLSKVGFVMNPEFLREGLAVEDFLKPDRIVIGSSDSRAGDIFQQIYMGIDAPVIKTSLTAAEMIKYASNSFLATKISFSNEIGNICKKLGIDVYDVMRAVGMDHRISPHFLNAGAGFGGSCFPKDVAALVHLAEEVGEDPILLKSVLDVNDRQPLRMVELLQSRIGALHGKRIAVLGLSFKNDTDDVRDSRAIPVILELKRLGAVISAYDPMANDTMHRIIPDIEYFESPSGALRGADACLVMTEWPQFKKLDMEFDEMKSKVILEGRRILSCRDVEGICW